MRILENSAKLFKILGVIYINQREDEIFISELWQTAIKSGSEKKKVFQKSVVSKSLRNNYEGFDFSIKIQAKMLQLY